MHVTGGAVAQRKGRMRPQVSDLALRCPWARLSLHAHAMGHLPLLAEQGTAAAAQPQNSCAAGVFTMPGYGASRACRDRGGCRCCGGAALLMAWRQLLLLVVQVPQQTGVEWIAERFQTRY